MFLACVGDADENLSQNHSIWDRFSSASPSVDFYLTEYTSGSVEIALSGIVLAKSALGLRETPHATIMPSNRSITGLKYTFPSAALISAMPATHRMLGAGALNSLASMFGGTSAISPP